jgi:ribosomal-protein-alanine N-acetyltransferase
MAEAVGLVLDYAFDDLRLHRVEAACLVHNKPSSNLLLKIGFTEEGVARQYLCIDGRWQDHRTFGILQADRRAKN